MRRLCGPDRKVRVSMILESATGLPQGLQAINQLTGDTRSYQRWHLSKSGGAWLGETDLVAVPLIRNGKYQIVVRLHEEGVPGDVSIPAGTHDVVLDDIAPHRIILEFPEAAIRNGLAALRERKGN
jgi:hypothetical protein